MLKKGFILSAVMLLVVSTFLYAATNYTTSYTISNTTAGETTTYVPVTTIVPQQSQILGYTVVPAVANAFSAYASLWDEKSLTLHSESNLIGESEAPAQESKDKAYVYPKMLKNQLMVVLGPYSSIILEYSK